MAGSQNVNLKQVSLKGKHIDPIGFLVSRKTPEDKEKVRSVDYELDVVKNKSEEPNATSNERGEGTEDEDRKDLEDKKDVDSARKSQPRENKESSNYFDWAQPSSPKLCRKKGNPTCRCKECVENYLNMRESPKELIVDEQKKNKAVNVREKTEEPLVDEEKKDEATPGGSRRVSTDSSEDDFVGTKCEDVQVAQPYRDKNGPPEYVAKLSNAGLYDPRAERTELDVVKNELEEPNTTSNVRCKGTEDEDSKDLEDKNNQPPKNKGSSNCFDQTHPSSPKLCRIKNNPTCLCKECVENCLNVRESPEEPLVDEEKKIRAVNVRDNTEEPIVDKKEKNKAVNVRDNTEEPLVDEEKKDEASPGVDSTSVRSRRVSETSRHTDSSEDDFVGTRCEDAQVTLPYPDKNGPAECIARLSNAGLYDPSEEHTGKAGDEDKISQVAINTAFFVKHPALEEQKNVRMDQYDKVDIEKGDPESEPLMRLTRRSVEKEPVYPGFCQCHKACLKLVGSFVLSMLIFPAFLFAAYAWLPFDAPLIPDVPTRLVYTLRCSTFASFPIVLGVIIHGISRLCASSYSPFKPQEREVTIHRRFVKQSTFLFVLFFFNLSVLATYLPQKHLKFIPLLTCLFSLSQLIYWLSFAVGRSFRGFGYGLTFLPLLSMLICNLYFMFVIEPEKMFFLGSRVVPQN